MRDLFESLPTAAVSTSTVCPSTHEFNSEKQMATTTAALNEQTAGTVEVRSTDYVPISERRGNPWHLVPARFQASGQLVTLSVGPLGVAAGLNLIWASIVITAGVLICSYLCGPERDEQARTDGRRLRRGTFRPVAIGTPTFAQLLAIATPVRARLRTALAELGIYASVRS
jgi:hypothetical protein